MRWSAPGRPGHRYVALHAAAQSDRVIQPGVGALDDSRLADPAPAPAVPRREIRPVQCLHCESRRVGGRAGIGRTGAVLSRCACRVVRFRPRASGGGPGLIGVEGPGGQPARARRRWTGSTAVAEMDGFDGSEVVHGGDQPPEILDPALLRAGRFDRRVTVNPPDTAGREEILALHTAGLARDSAGPSRNRAASAGASAHHCLYGAATRTFPGVYHLSRQRHQLRSGSPAAGGRAAVVRGRAGDRTVDRPDQRDLRGGRADGRRPRRTGRVAAVAGAASGRSRLAPALRAAGPDWHAACADPRAPGRPHPGDR